MKKLNKKGQLGKIVITIIIILIASYLIFKFILPWANSFGVKDNRTGANEYLTVQYIGIQDSTTVKNPCQNAGDNKFACPKDEEVFFYVGLNNTGKKTSAVTPKVVIGFSCKNNEYTKCTSQEWLEDGSSCKNIPPESSKDCPIRIGYRFRTTGEYTVYPAARCNDEACGFSANSPADGLILYNQQNYLIIEVS